MLDWGVIFFKRYIARRPPPWVFYLLVALALGSPFLSRYPVGARWLGETNYVQYLVSHAVSTNTNHLAERVATLEAQENRYADQLAMLYHEANTIYLWQYAFSLTMLTEYADLLETQNASVIPSPVVAMCITNNARTIGVLSYRERGILYQVCDLAESSPYYQNLLDYWRKLNNGNN